MLWLNTSGAASSTRSTADRSPRKSGVSTSTTAPVRCAHGQDTAAEVIRAAVGQIVARHRRDDDVPQPQAMRRLRHAGRLVVFERIGRTLGHGAEAAGASADIAEDHKGGGAARIALGPIGAARVFTDRLQAQLA